MSESRRHQNPGKRERQARKRHRRAVHWSSVDGAVHGPLKVGSKHLGRTWSRILGIKSDSQSGMAVADAGNS